MVIGLDKHEKAREKENLVDNIIDERLRLGIITSEREEIDLWGTPRKDLEKMLNELRLR